MTGRARWIAVAAAVAAAVYVLSFRLGEGGRGLPAWDTYAHFYPNMLYAVRAIHDGGRGLLWNALQNCGQPFLANVEVGLLYPANLFFLLLQPDHALRAVLFVDVVVAVGFAYLLCRTLGLGLVAALGGGLVFALGNAMAFVTVWAPQAMAPLAWFPAALWCCERLVQRPSARRGVALGLVLAVALLPGFPQTLLFTYQMVALRVVYELATRRVERRLALVASTLLGFALPVCLDAVQLFPALEVVRESVRSARLTLNETSVLGRLELADFTRGAVFRSALHSPFVFAPVLIASTAFFRRATRRVAIFYAAAGVLYFVLALGRSTVLFEWYTQLPWGGLFREPVRFMWVASVCLAVLTAIGLEALGARDRGRPTAWAAALVVGLVAIAFQDGAPGGLLRAESWVGGIAVGAFVLAAVWPARAAVFAFVAMAVAVANLVVAPPGTYMALLADGSPLRTHAEVFEAIRARLTAQERIYVAPRFQKFDLMQKTASVFGIPSIQDYGSQTTARYATLYLRLRVPRRLQSRFDTDFLFFGDALYANTNRRLLDLVGTKYLVAAAGAEGTIAGYPGVRSMLAGDVHVYENPQAQPRAFWVPQIEVIEDPDRILWSLASGQQDLRRVAFVESPRPSTGGPGDGRAGQVGFVRNDPEHLTLQVDAPARGFLVLSDQYFPGWYARVDGTPADVVRANYAFRLVEVPAGRSTVEFWYAPPSVRIGAVVSALTIVAVGLFLWRTRGA